jgi:hypothetical protein
MTFLQKCLGGGGGGFEAFVNCKRHLMQRTFSALSSRDTLLYMQSGRVTQGHYLAARI